MKRPIVALVSRLERVSRPWVREGQLRWSAGRSQSCGAGAEIPGEEGCRSFQDTVPEGRVLP